MKKRGFWIKNLAIIAGLSLFFISSLELVRYREKKDSFYALSREVKQLSKPFRDNCSFAIKDLYFKNLSLSFKKDKMMPAASLIKLPILAAALKAAKEGRIYLKQEVTIGKDDLAGGSGVLKKMKLPLRLTVKKLLELMISASDNTATNKIIGLLGFDYLNDKFAALHLKGTVLKRKMMDFYSRQRGAENYTTVSDVSMLLEMFYNKKFINKTFSRFALSLLRNQKIKDRLPRYLPKEVEIAHKTGLERGAVHDAGIVFAPKGDYLIAVLTERIGSYRKAKKFIARFSLLTYNYYR